MDGVLGSNALFSAHGCVDVNWSSTLPLTSMGAASMKLPVVTKRYKLAGCPSRNTLFASCSRHCIAVVMYPPCEPPISHNSGTRFGRKRRGRASRFCWAPRSSSRATAETMSRFK